MSGLISTLAVFAASVLAGLIPYLIASTTTENFNHVINHLGLGTILGFLFLRFTPDYLNAFLTGSFDLDPSSNFNELSDHEFYTKFMRNFLFGILSTIILDQSITWLARPKKSIPEDQQRQRQSAYSKNFRAFVLVISLSVQSLFQTNIIRWEANVLDQYYNNEFYDACKPQSTSNISNWASNYPISLVKVSANIIVQKVALGLAIGFFCLTKPAISKWVASPLIVFWALITPLWLAFELTWPAYDSLKCCNSGALGALFYVTYCEIAKPHQDRIAKKIKDDSRGNSGFERISLLTVGILAAYSFITLDDHFQMTVRQRQNEILNCSNMKIGSPFNVDSIKGSFKEYVGCIENVNSLSVSAVNTHSHSHGMEPDEAGRELKKCYTENLGGQPYNKLTTICYNVSNTDVLAATWKFFKVENKEFPTWSQLSDANPGDPDHAKACFRQNFDKITGDFEKQMKKCNKTQPSVQEGSDDSYFDYNNF